MSLSTRLGYLFSKQSVSAGYAAQSLAETRLSGRIAATIAVPLICFFIWQDLVLVKLPEFLPSRLTSLLLFLVSGLSLWTLRRNGRWIYLVHGLALAGLIVMNCHLIFVVYTRYHEFEVHREMTLNAISINLFATYLLAGGLRRLVPLVAFLPLTALVLILLALGSLEPSGISWFSNPFMVAIIVSGLSLAQEGSRRREYENKSLSDLRLNQLEAFLDAITETAFLIDLEGRVIFGNQTGAWRLGLELSEIKGRLIWDFLPAEVATRRRAQVREALRTGKAQRFEDQRGEICFDQVIYPVRDREGDIRFLAIFGKDISAMKQREEKLVHEALHDPLTGLANRRTLVTRLGQAIGRARRGYPSCLLYIDLDHFKEVNDQCGHDRGDKVLVAIALILAEGGRGHDAAFRIGGDEFAMLLEGVTIAEAATVAERIRATVHARGFLEASACTAALGLSVGCVSVDGEASVDQVIKRADEAMYQAKRSGRDRVVRGGQPVP